MASRPKILQVFENGKGTTRFFIFEGFQEGSKMMVTTQHTDHDVVTAVELIANGSKAVAFMRGASHPIRVAAAIIDGVFSAGVLMLRTFLADME